MSTVLVLVGLLAVSYLGGFLVAERAGLQAGVEYAALGFVLGPSVFGVVGGDTLAAFEPVVQVGLGWLAFAAGLDFGRAGNRRVGVGSMALGSAGALLTGGSVAAATWWAASRLHIGGTPREHILLAGGTGAASSETARHAVRWVAERYGARGALTDRLNELAHVGDLLPLLGVAVLFAFEPARGVVVGVPLRDWPAITMGLGLFLGAGAAWLLRSERGIENAWGLLFGVALIGIGASLRLGLSAMTSSFVAGGALSFLSRHGPAVRDMVAPTERPVLLPVLLLAGARLDFHAIAALPWIAGAAIGAQVAARVVLGWMVATASRPARTGGVLVGLSLGSSGAMAMSVGLAFALHFPGAIGNAVLVTAVLSATVGTLLGPARLRRTLELAGETRVATHRGRGPESTT